MRRLTPGPSAAKPGAYSLSRRLLLSTVGSSIVVGLVSTAIVLAIAWQETSEAFDDTLEEGAKLALTLGEDVARGGFARQQGDALSMRIDYQLIGRDGGIVRRGNDAPTLPFVDPASPGERFYDTRVDGDWWRVYVLRQDRLGFSVQVGQEWDERVGLIGDVLESLAWPLAALWLLLGLVNAWLVRRLTRPLDRLTRALAAKSPDDLSPMPADDPAVEIRSVATALNQLLGRLDIALERERRFTADAAHELRTPLAALGSRVQLMQRSHREAASPVLAADLQRVRDDVGRATALVENLLQLARLDPQSADATAMTTVDTEALFGEVLRACQPGATARRVELVARPEVATLVGNRAWLYSALRNLVDNAVRHGAQAGRVELTARRVGASLELSVRDDGPGVAPADRDRLAQRFFRVVGTEAGGSGLGLSIVARVAELHGARLGFGDGLDGRGLGVTLHWAAPPGRGTASPVRAANGRRAGLRPSSSSDA